MSVEPRKYLIFLRSALLQEHFYKPQAIDATPEGAICRVTFQSGRIYDYSASNVKVYPLISTKENIRIYQNGRCLSQYNIIDDYGIYCIFRGKDHASSPIRKSNEIEIYEIKHDLKRLKSILSYFKEIINTSKSLSFDIQREENNSKDINNVSSDIIKKALGNINLEEVRSILPHYLDGTMPPKSQPVTSYIFPFGCNESQKKAVEAALTNSLSIIEGPPGTGKTQTILNIIANLTARGKTVAVVSNNNSAVFNVQDKLIKYNYGFLFASLGNSENKKAFFDGIKPQDVDSNFQITKEKSIELRNELKSFEERLDTCFRKRNRLATLKAELADAEVEFEHIKLSQPLSNELKEHFDKRFKCRWSIAKAISLRELLANVRVMPWVIFQLMMRFSLYDVRGIKHQINELTTYANHKFYELRIRYTRMIVDELEKWLAYNDEKLILKRYIELSIAIYNGVLYNKYIELPHNDFNVGNYFMCFDEFVKRYPVITSSTLSLHTSVPDDFLFDYLIIDEASQVDIVKSSLCLAKCKNAVIVGDSMQLNHIVYEASATAAESLLLQYNVNEAYNYVDKNILNSIKAVYGETVPCNMLREHYRCHPTIIGFCNKKYYNNMLIVMSENTTHPFKIIETNITGAYMNTNQRQVDETLKYINEYFIGQLHDVGVVSPYRDHANLLKSQLPAEVLADTIHKFQGGEKGTIIFNTVRGKVSSFLDNPNLINVAVSRAKDQFIIVKPRSMELPHGTNIGDLIRYICYTTTPEDTIIDGAVCSVFDLLYKEYNKVFTAFIDANQAIKGSAAEIVIHKLLVEILSVPQYNTINFVREYRLRDLVRDYSSFNDDEVNFIRRNSRLDFLLFNTIDKSPILAIEVDGKSFHSNTIQQERDVKKNHILETIGLPLLRLSTDGHNEREQILNSLNIAMKLNE